MQKPFGVENYSLFGEQFCMDCAIRRFASSTFTAYFVEVNIRSVMRNTLSMAGR